MLTVRVWPKGYAEAHGPATLRLEPDADVGTAVRKAYGSLAKIYEIKDDAPVQARLSPAERDAYARTFRGDRS